MTSAQTFFRRAAEARRSPDAFLADANWYADQRRWIGQLAETLALSFETVCGVVSALSPQVSWDIQRRDTEPFIRAELARRGSGRHAGFKANLRKARRILRGEAPLTVLGGNKVTAFYLALRGDADAVVIDRHMADILSIRRPDKVSQYRHGVSAIRAVAERFGLPPAALQAAVWCYWRRVKSNPF